MSTSISTKSNFGMVPKHLISGHILPFLDGKKRVLKCAKTLRIFSDEQGVKILDELLTSRIIKGDLMKNLKGLGIKIQGDENVIIKWGALALINVSKDIGKIYNELKSDGTVRKITGENMLKTIAYEGDDKIYTGRKARHMINKVVYDKLSNPMKKNIFEDDKFELIIDSNF